MDKKSKCDHSFEPPGDEHSNDHTYKAPFVTPQKPAGVPEHLLLITLHASQATLGTANDSSIFSVPFATAFKLIIVKYKGKEFLKKLKKNKMNDL